MVILRSPFASSQAQQLRFGSVLLRAPSLSDYEEWVELRSQSRDFLTPWEPQWAANEFSKFSFRARIKHYNQMMKNDVGYPFFIFHYTQGHLLGAITANNVRRGVAQMCSVGYWIGTPYARQGFMRQALNGLIVHAFENLSLHRVEAACLPSNAASIALLRGCGFSHEGMARKYLKIAGNWEDHLLFARLAESAI